eukprot:20397-Eustigmatos_ZCMA.PRE.1
MQELQPSTLCERGYRAIFRLQTPESSNILLVCHKHLQAEEVLVKVCDIGAWPLAMPDAHCSMLDAQRSMHNAQR